MRDRDRAIDIDSSGVVARPGVGPGRAEGAERGVGIGAHPCAVREQHEGSRMVRREPDSTAQLSLPPYGPLC